MKFGGGVLETYAECVWVEIPTSDGFNFLVGNYYFPPLFDDVEFVEHFETVQKKVDFSKFRVLIYGNFNLPGIDWSTGVASCSSSVTSRKACWLLSFIIFFDFHQYNALANSHGNVLDLCLSNAPLDPTIPAANPLVPVDAYHPPFKTKFCLSCRPRVNRSSAAYC
ncbi:unnamed protein product [Ixodes pacificus]